MHGVEKILKFENPFAQKFYLNYSLRNIELNIHLPFSSMYFETMLQSVTGRPLYSICCIWSDSIGIYPYGPDRTRTV